MKKVTIVKKWQKKWKKFISNQCMMRYQYRKSFNVFLFWCIYYATSKKLSLINSWCFRYINNVNTIKYRHFVRSRSFNFAFFFIFTSIYHFTSILVFIIQISMKICEIRKRHRLIWNDLIQRDCKWTLNEFNDLSRLSVYTRDVSINTRDISINTRNVSINTRDEIILTFSIIITTNFFLFKLKIHFITLNKIDDVILFTKLSDNKTSRKLKCKIFQTIDLFTHIDLLFKRISFNWSTWFTIETSSMTIIALTLDKKSKQCYKQ